MGSAEEKEKPSTTLPGTVEKIIKPILAGEAEKAQIDIEGAEELYREIRVDNTLKWRELHIRFSPSLWVACIDERELFPGTHSLSYLINCDPQIAGH